MKNILRYILLLCLLTVCHTSAYPGASVLRGLSVSDGLSDLLVNAIYKDSLGFVWIGTGNSLDRFDGIHIRRYPVTGPDEKLKRVNAIAEMSGNQLWMGNGMGLWRLNKTQNALELIVPDKINCAVYALLHDGQGTLYIGSEKGLFVYKDGSLEQLWLDKNTLSDSNAITGLWLDGRGMLWMATGKGLYALRLSDKSVTAYHNVEDGGKHVCAFNAIAGIGPMVYLGTMDRGILSFDTRTGEFDRFVDVGCNIISALSSDGQDMLYVGTDGNGVHFIETGREKVVHTMRHETGNSESLRSNSVYSLLVDRDGGVWVGFYQLGLDYTLYQSDLFTTYAYPPYFNSKDMPIRALAVNGQERLVGSRNGLFYIDEQRNRFRSFKSPQMRSDMVFCILFHEGEYYVGTYGGGMYVFNPVTLTLRDFDPDVTQPFVKGHIFCLEQDEERQLWIGTSEGLFCYKNGKQVAHYTNANSRLPEGNVYEIYFDSARKGWICTENGICIWDPSSERLRTDVFPEGFIHKEKIRVVYEDSGHSLYFFPDKGALFISDLSMESFHRLTPGTPLEGRDGMFIIEDRDNWLWMGTSNGLFRYDKHDSFVPYNFVDGIPGATFTLCPPVCDAAGNFWFGNSKGLVCLDMDYLERSRQGFYPVRVTAVLINGRLAASPIAQRTHGIPETRLEPSQKNVTFCFSDFSYTAPSFMSYEYQLEGVDEGWMAVTGSSEVTYYDLPSGSYRFKVRRMGQPESEFCMQVRIASSVSGWMMAGVVIMAMAGGGYALYRRRGNRPVAVPAAVVTSPATEQWAAEAKPAAEEKYKTLKVSEEECRRLTGKLEEVMHRDKPYIHPDLKIADLAAAIGTSAHTLSYLFNQYLDRNYYDYINDYRIAEFKRLASEDEYARYTLDALAGLCGFSSRASFFRYFKKSTGITPSEYIRSLGGDDE